MNTLFLVICSVSVVFFVVFLLECSRPLRKPNKTPIVRKAPAAAVIDSATGRRFLVHLEQQMADFLSAHHRTTALLLIVMVLISVPLCTHGQRTQPPVPPSSDTDQQASVSRLSDGIKPAGGNTGAPGSVVADLNRT